MGKGLLVRFEAQHPWEAGEVKAEGRNEAAQGRSLPFWGWRRWAWSWLMLGGAREAREVRSASLHSGGGGEDRVGTGVRPDGKQPCSRARLFDPEPRAPAGSGTTPSDPLHGASRAQPLMKILGLARLGRPAQGAARTAAVSLILHSEPWHAGTSVLSRSGQNRIPPPQPTPRARPS
jgi:hypothetical protein